MYIASNKLLANRKTHVDSNIYHISFLQCPLYSVARRKLLLKINNIVQEDFVLTSVLNQNSYQLLTLFFQGSDRLSLASNESIFAVMFEFIQTSGRFNTFQL